MQLSMLQYNIPLDITGYFGDKFYFPKMNCTGIDNQTHNNHDKRHTLYLRGSEPVAVSDSNALYPEMNDLCQSPEQ